MRYQEQSNSKRQKVEWWLLAVDGGENRELLFIGYTVSVWMLESSVIHKVMTAPQCECYLMPLNCTLRNGYNGEFYVVSYIFVFYFLYLFMLYLTTKKVKENKCQSWIRSLCSQDPLVAPLGPLSPFQENALHFCSKLTGRQTSLENQWLRICTYDAGVVLSLVGELSSHIHAAWPKVKQKNY